MLDFDGIFFMTEDEEKMFEDYTNGLENKKKEFWLSKGLTEEQYKKLNELEQKEFSKLHPYEEWFDSQWLLGKGSITIEDVLKKID